MKVDDNVQQAELAREDDEWWEAAAEKHRNVG
jgi:hypothetical protein